MISQAAVLRKDRSQMREQYSGNSGDYCSNPGEGTQASGAVGHGQVWIHVWKSSLHGLLAGGIWATIYKKESRITAVSPTKPWARPFLYSTLSPSTLWGPPDSISLKIVSNLCIINGWRYCCPCSNLSFLFQNQQDHESVPPRCTHTPLQFPAPSLSWVGSDLFSNLSVLPRCSFWCITRWV